MKKLVSIFLLLSALDAFAQENPTYPELLNSVEEIMVTDSMLIDAKIDARNLMDTQAVKKWFPNLLPTTPNNRLKNRNYYLAGKMTANTHFDLLLVLEEKKKDSTGTQVVYLVTRKKEGAFISSLEVAVAGTKKNSSFNTTSWLYKDNKIVLSSRMIVNNHNYDDLLTYKINKGGRFILAPKY